MSCVKSVLPVRLNLYSLPSHQVRHWGFRPLISLPDKEGGRAGSAAMIDAGRFITSSSLMGRVPVFLPFDDPVFVFVTDDMGNMLLLCAIP